MIMIMIIIKNKVYLCIISKNLRKNMQFNHKINLIKKAYIYFMLFSVTANAISVQDSKGTFTLDYIPKRIIILEYSFADTLALIDVSPVGIADDNQPERLIPEIRKVMGAYTSLGRRAEPSLEVIASLNPDLIIADTNRHKGVYNALSKLAPTILLPSKNSSYKETLEVANKLSIILGKSTEMKKRLKEHKKYLANISKNLPKNLEVIVGIARENKFNISSANSYISELLNTAGFQYKSNKREDNTPIYAGFEQLLALNPMYLILGEHVKPSIIDKWKKEPLWKALKCSQDGHILDLDSNLLARNRGIIGGERIINELVQKLKK